MTPFEAYKTYQAVRLHFTSDKFDFFKYRTVNATQEKFDTRNDKYFYHKLSKHPDPVLFLASNFREETNIWIGSLFDEKCLTRYSDTKKRLESLEYNFTKEVKQYDTLDEALRIVRGDWPQILYGYKRKSVSPETMVILDSLTQCFGYWTHEGQEVSDTVILPVLVRSLKKYRPFVEFDRQRFKNVIQNIFS